MRPETRNLGPISTATPDTTPYDVSNYRSKSLQLAGNFGGATVNVFGSLDGGTTYSQIATASAVGFVTLPDIVLGKLKVSVVGGAAPSIDVWFGGLNSRTD